MVELPITIFSINMTSEVESNNYAQQLLLVSVYPFVVWKDVECKKGVFILCVCVCVCFGHCTLCVHV